MARDVGIGVGFGVVVLAAAGTYFYRTAGSDPDLVALESFVQSAPGGRGTSVRKPPDSGPTTLTAVRSGAEAPPASAVQRPPPAAPAPGGRIVSAASDAGRDPAGGQAGGATPAAAGGSTAAMMPVEPSGGGAAPGRAAAGFERQSEARPAATGPGSYETAPPAAAPSVPPRTPIIHQVRPGESLSMIADRYYGSASKYPLILKANPELVDEHAIRAGAKLVIPDPAAAGGGINVGRAGPGAPPATTAAAGAAPPPLPADASSSTAAGSYTVQEGDTLAGIARRYLGDDRRWKELHRLNRKTIGANPGNLRPGMVLKLPGGGPSSRAPAGRSRSPSVAAAGTRSAEAADVSGKRAGGRSASARRFGAATPRQRVTRTVSTAGQSSARKSGGAECRDGACRVTASSDPARVAVSAGAGSMQSLAAPQRAAASTNGRAGTQGAAQSSSSKRY